MKPVHQLDVRVAPHLAEHGSAFDRPVAEAVELSEKGGAAYFCHVTNPLTRSLGDFCKKHTSLLVFSPVSCVATTVTESRYAPVVAP
jgi:hypothetical protein